MPTEMRTIATDKAPKAIGPYSQAIVAGDLVFCAGQGAIDAATGENRKGDVASETETTFDNISAVLAAADSDLAHVVKTTVFLVDMADFAAMNEVYAKPFGGPVVGIGDVPGHQDFIRNMLAGVGGIDAVVLVVAADEGVMPQTREHLAILELLGIERGVIALTKRDLVDDEWATLVRSEVRAALAATPLANAPLVEVSATTRRGLDDLMAALEAVLGAAPARRDLARPRLPIDRAFTITGVGTVVTGTLVDGPPP